MKYCDNCGKPLMDNVGYCGYCGRKCETGSSNRKSSKVWNKVLIGAVVLVAIVITTAVLFAKRSKTPTVRNASEAVAYLKALGEELGYKNAFSELTEKGTTKIDGDTYFRLQQNYKGIPVYGSAVVYVTDESGGCLAITGNAADVNENIGLKATVSEELLYTGIEQYAIQKLGFEYNNCAISIISYNELMLYVTPSQETALVYDLIVDINEKPYRILTDAHDATVYKSNCLQQDDSVTAEVYIGDRSTEVNIWEKEGQYICHDAVNNVSFYSANGETFKKILKFTEDDGAVFYYYSDEKEWRDQWGNATSMPTGTPSRSEYLLSTKENIKGITVPTASSLESFDQDAMRMMAFFNITNRFYQEVLSRDGWEDKYDDNLTFLYDCANGSFHSSPSPELHLISIHSGESLNSVSHELTHAMEQSESRMDYSGESGAIMEALSDIFAEMVECKFLGECDWKYCGGVRDITNPQNSTEGNLAHPSVYKGEYWNDPDDLSRDEGWVHFNSTVISHACYLMSKSGNGCLEMDDLAQLWYRAMLMMPSDCSFAECRALVEIAAESMNFSEAKKQCVRDAFDAVGIENTDSHSAPCDYRVSPDSTVSILDSEGSPFAGYTLRISNTTTDAAFIAISYASGVSYNRTLFMNSNEPYSLSLPEGHYLLTVSCQDYPEMTYSINVNIDKTAPRKNIPVYTGYAPRMVAVLNGTEETPAPQLTSNGSLLTQANRYQDGKLIESTYLRYDENDFLAEAKTAFIRDDGSEGKSLLRFSCDSQGRMVKYESWYDDFTGEASETVTYEYNEDGRLIQENHIRGNELVGYVIYEYDERGNLCKASARNKSGALESVHLYDTEGKVIQSTIWLPNGDTETYDHVDDPHPDRVEKYPPVTVSWITTENCAGVDLLDSVGKTMYGFPIQGSNLVFDENNLLIETKDWSMGVEYVYKFFYNGEIPEDSLAFPSSAAGAESPNGGSLRYPISEEDCYIIFRNYYGFDMFDLADEAASVEVSRMGEGDNEMLFFDIQMEILPGEPLETWGFFNVYVNTGVCTGGAQGHSDLWPVFQADDYYY